MSVDEGVCAYRVAGVCQAIYMKRDKYSNNSFRFVFRYVVSFLLFLPMAYGIDSF